jgi:hypothetical protein
MQSAPFSIGTGNNVIIEGTSGYFIEIFGIVAKMGALCNLTVKSGSNTLMGSMPFVAGGDLVLPFSPTQAQMRCGDGEDFILNLTGLGATSGGVVFYELTL